MPEVKKPQPIPKWVKHLGILIVIKVLILIGIKHIWFDAPTIPKDGTEQVAEYFLVQPNSQ